MSTKKMKSLFQKVATLCAVFLAVSNVYPPLRGLSGYNLFTLGAMAGWILITFISNPAFYTVFSKRPVYRLIVIGFVIYTIIVPYAFGNGVIGNRYFINAQFLIFYLIYQYNKYYGYQDSNKNVVKISLPFIIITSITTMRNLADNPWLSRNIKSTGDRTSFLLSQGIGGYEFIYFLVIVVIILAFIILNRKELKIPKIHVAISVALLVLFMITVAYANFFTALAILGISLFVLVMTKKYKLRTKFMWALAGIFIMLQGQNIFLAITNWLIINLNGGYTVTRIISLQNSILGNGGGGSLLAERLPVYQASIEAFLENPLFGKVITNDLYYNKGFLVGFGQHSQILDTFALFGLVVGLLNVYIILYPFLKRMRGNSLNKSLNLAVFVSVLILFTLNNISPSIGFGAFFIYPTIHDWVKNRIGAKSITEELSENYKTSSRKIVEYSELS